jgi:hypothetical protein
MHKATKRFWQLHRLLPNEVQQAARKHFALLRANPHHGSVQFKKINMVAGQELWSARVNLQYRALAYKRGDGWTWFWIGDHGTYDLLIK